MTVEHDEHAVANPATDATEPEAAAPPEAPVPEAAAFAAGAPAPGAEAPAAEAAPEAEPARPPEDVLREERDAARDQALRARAELDNAQKRMRRELEAQRQFAAADTLRAILPVLDHLDMSLEAARQGAGDPDALLQGVVMIRDELERVLLDRGAKRIEAESKPFDPSVHEALTVVPVAEGQEPNTVVQELRRGYMLKDRVLRAAQVIVAK